MRQYVLAAGAAVLTLFSAPAWVHHSGAMFDTSKEVKITGTVMEFHWTNPHSSFKLNVANPDGTDAVWAVEMNSPNNLVREGWKRTTLKPGDKVTATVHPLKDGTPGGMYMSITLADGTTLTAQPQQQKGY